MSSVSITVRIQDGIARITLNRPPLNVLDIELLRRLNDALRECDATSIRAVVLSSALPRAFSAGVEVRDHRAGPARCDAVGSPGKCATPLESEAGDDRRHSWIDAPRGGGD